jgi:peptide/nickel transport system permease protein
MRATLARFWDGDLAWSWRHTPVAMVATFLLIWQRLICLMH